jgi:hypothetical protein
LQEQQSRAALTKLELDEVIEAKTIVSGIMAKIAEFPDAPRDPFIAAEEMFNSSNPVVRAGGEKFLKSLQILQTYKNQRDYETSQQSSAGAPAAAAAAPNVDLALSKFVAGTKQTPEGDVAPYFSIAGQPASEEEYTRQREAIMLPQPANALAAGNVNAMVKPISPLQDPAALMKQIQDGDDRFARGGTPAPGWKNKRDLLVNALEQSLKPGRGDGERYLGLGAGRALDKFTGQVISADKIPAAATGPRIFYIKGVPHTLNEEGNLEALPIEGGAAPTPVAAQAVAPPKITTVKGVPYTFNFETGRLEPVPVEGGVSTAAAAQPQAAPKITTIKGIPYTFDADTRKFIRVPVEGGLPAAAGKGGATKPATAGATDIKPLTEAQAIKRRDMVGKEFKSATSALQTTQDVLDSIAFVKAEPGLARATGFTGTMLPSFPEGAAASADVRLANVKGKVTALGKAAAAASGAIGSIATVEWKILSDQIAAIDPVKGTGPLLAQLDLVEQQAQGAMSRIRDGYERQFGEDFERFPQFSNLPPPKSAVKPKTPKAPEPTPAAGAGAFKYLGKVGNK